MMTAYFLLEEENQPDNRIRVSVIVSTLNILQSHNYNFAGSMLPPSAMSTSSKVFHEH